MLIQVIKAHENLKNFWKDIHLMMNTYKTEEIECYQILDYIDNFNTDNNKNNFYGLYVFNSNENFEKNIFKHINKVNCKRDTRTFYTLNVLTHLKNEMNSEVVDWTAYKNQLIVWHQQQVRHYKIRYLGKVDRFIATTDNK